MIATYENIHPAGRFFGMCRVSTLDQIEGYSLDVQKKQLQAWYDQMLAPRGVEFGEIVREPGISAYKIPFRQRPKGSMLWNALRRGDYLVMTKLDRAFRDTVDCLQTYEAAVQRGIKLVMLDVPMSGNNSATDELILTVIAAVSRFESRRKAERVAEARAMAKALGRATGGPRPWGHWWIGTRGKKYLAPFELELYLIHTAAKLRTAGETLEQTSECICRLVAEIEGQKYRQDKPISVAGRRWSIGTVRDACVQYQQDANLRELADKCADFWQPSQNGFGHQGG